MCLDLCYAHRVDHLLLSAFPRGMWPNTFLCNIAQLQTCLIEVMCLDIHISHIYHSISCRDDLFDTAVTDFCTFWLARGFLGAELFHKRRHFPLPKARNRLSDLCTWHIHFCNPMSIEWPQIWLIQKQMIWTESKWVSRNVILELETPEASLVPVFLMPHCLYRVGSQEPTCLARSCASRSNSLTPLHIE